VTSPVDRTIRVPGLGNARDLGGLPLAGGGETRRGRIVRSDRPDDLDEPGWSRLADAGITSIVDLRGARESARAGARLPAAARPIEDEDDVAFVERWDFDLSRPHYYADAVATWPALIVAALDAIAEAPADGAVLVHCAAGRDRTGMIAALVLDAAGVPREHVHEDYAAGVRGFNAMLPLPAVPHEIRRDDAELSALLEERRGVLDDFLDGDLPDEVRAAAGRAAGRLLATDPAA
jgi:protein-tyrosine phosphatase